MLLRANVAGGGDLTWGVDVAGPKAIHPVPNNAGFIYERLLSCVATFFWQTRRFCRVTILAHGVSNLTTDNAFEVIAKLVGRSFVAARFNFGSLKTALEMIHF